MGSVQARTRNRKGVTYSTDNNEVVDCLFCRIVRGESPANHLWYRDDQCAMFIPRGPAARLHFLIVPLVHIRTINSLTEEHRPLLEHMRKVAMEQLRVHAQHIGSAEAPLLPLAAPPDQYAFNRGHLPALHSSSDVYKDETTPIDLSFDLCFHRPPYNSIDHLHLHALQKPHRTWRSRLMFTENAPWHASLDSVLHHLSSPKSKL
ncbi:unnamed protein product [Rotaria magnacalcarata]|uniref:Adenosine 5'-monophosphoramidase HINT3 n=2 Tax=Rotaria magnacalcarata TaxID=392030 RepID=A0A816T6F8_9BILA|nr:unnamed protein product [Rotaria magnacalcarata]CAF1328077.1 unnamed protein product [Rotaria magnacalcarata]CAF2030287.1 unnamed protein product [Rotaria magnacalcarata]CAF2092506.1 unnamed protein product [Rotaria magnacalcarata]CAF3774758.1 unnamed protein product [Rotaria magnacalcarata]